MFKRPGGLVGDGRDEHECKQKRSPPPAAPLPTGSHSPPRCPDDALHAILGAAVALRVEERLGQGGMTISPIMVLRAGLTRSMDLCLTGKMIDGVKAVEMGLINRAVPKDELDKEVRELAAGDDRRVVPGAVRRHGKAAVAGGSAPRGV